MTVAGDGNRVADDPVASDADAGTREDGRVACDGGNPVGDTGTESHGARARRLAREASAVRDGFEPPNAPPDEQRALRCARDGFGEAVGAYVEARLDDGHDRFEQSELDALHAAANDWLAMYVRCYGVESEPSVTVRAAAEALLDTHDVVEVARLMTGVPERD